MVDLLTLVPTTITGAVMLLVSSLIAAVVLIISDKLIAHNMEIKHSFILSFIALFAAPIIGSLIASFVKLPDEVSLIFYMYLFPLIVWLGFGEVLLSSDAITKLKVVVVAFIIYSVLNIFLMPQIIPMVIGALPL